MGNLSFHLLGAGPEKDPKTDGNVRSTQQRTRVDTRVQTLASPEDLERQGPITSEGHGQTDQRSKTPKNPSIEPSNDQRIQEWQT